MTSNTRQSGLDFAQLSVGIMHYYGMALLKTALKRCVGSIFLPPKDILQDCSRLMTGTSTLKVLLKTWRKPFAGTGAPKQWVALKLHPSCRGWARELAQ